MRRTSLAIAVAALLVLGGLGLALQLQSSAPTIVIAAADNRSDGPLYVLPGYVPDGVALVAADSAAVARPDPSATVALAHRNAGGIGQLAMLWVSHEAFIGPPSGDELTVDLGGERARGTPGDGADLMLGYQRDDGLHVSILVPQDADSVDLARRIHRAVDLSAVGDGQITIGALPGGWSVLGQIMRGNGYGARSTTIDGSEGWTVETPEGGAVAWSPRAGTNVIVTGDLPVDELETVAHRLRIVDEAEWTVWVDGSAAATGP